MYDRLRAAFDFRISRVLWLLLWIVRFCEGIGQSNYCFLEAKHDSFQRYCPANRGFPSSRADKEARSVIIERNGLARSQPDDYNPWTHEPICTEPLNGTTEVCLFTRADWLHGRGISFLTTRDVARTITAAPWFHKPVSASENISVSSLEYSERLPKVGKISYAKENFTRGDVIGLTSPVFVVNLERALSRDSRETLLQAALSRLPSKLQETVKNLTLETQGSPHLMSNIVKSHGGFPMYLAGELHAGLPPEFALMNNHCAPNTIPRIDHDSMMVSAYAARSITRGEELTIPYYSELHFEPTAKRQQVLLDRAGFACVCSRCQSAESSDLALGDILSIERDLDHWFLNENATIDGAEQLIKLYEQQGLQVFLERAYGRTALAHSAAGHFEETAYYASLAANAAWLRDDPDEPNIEDWQSLGAHPAQHPTWLCHDRGQCIEASLNRTRPNDSQYGSPD